jgi:hypothetical protein
MLRGGVYTEISKKTGKREYAPPIDGRGPMLFFPPHCQKLDKYGIYESPIIGYVESKSIIQKKLLQ